MHIGEQGIRCKKGEYDVNTEWRKHAVNFINKKKRNNKFTIEQYCDNDKNYSLTLTEWKVFLEEEEQIIFYNTIVDICINDACQSLKLLNEYKDKDVLLRIPLLRDTCISYAKAFRNNHGRFSESGRYKIDDFKPSDESLISLHNKILADRDTVFAHIDLLALSPRTSTFGISFRGQGRWEDYEALLPNFSILFNEFRSYLADCKTRNSFEKYISKYENRPALVNGAPEKLNRLYQTEIDSIVL